MYATSWDIADARLSQAVKTIFANAIEVCPGPGPARIECANTELVAQPGLDVFKRSNWPETGLSRVLKSFGISHDEREANGTRHDNCKHRIADHGGRISARNFRSVRAKFILDLPRSSSFWTSVGGVCSFRDLCRGDRHAAGPVTRK